MVNPAPSPISSRFSSIIADPPKPCYIAEDFSHIHLWHNIFINFNGLSGSIVKSDMRRHESYKEHKKVTNKGSCIKVRHLKKEDIMKYQKIVLTVAVASFLLLSLHQSLAAKKYAVNSKLKNAKPLTVAANTPLKKSLNTTSLIANPALSTKSTTASTSTGSTLANSASSGLTQTSIKNDIATTTPAKSSVVGSVAFTVGKDSNIDPDKSNIRATFFQIDPTVKLKTGNLTTSLGASIKDFGDQQQSDTLSQNEAKIDLTYKGQLSKIVTSTSTIAALYHDERWPDFMGGTANTPADKGMPIRYADSSFTQKLGLNPGGSITSEIGGKILHRNGLSPYTDFASDILQKRYFERDYNEMSAFGKLAWSPNSHLEIALNPLLKQIKYLNRDGKQPDGATGGTLARAPKYQLITSELGLDFGIKFGQSNITPKAVVGQIADKSMGAEDQNYVGVGLSSALVLDAKTELTVSPSVMYKKNTYDNWTKGVISALPAGTRVDHEISTGVEASVKFTKNLGLNLAYNFMQERSNISSDGSENYNQEIVTSALKLEF